MICNYKDKDAEEQMASDINDSLYTSMDEDEDGTRQIWQLGQVGNFDSGDWRLYFDILAHPIFA